MGRSGLIVHGLACNALLRVGEPVWIAAISKRRYTGAFMWAMKRCNAGVMPLRERRYTT